MEKEDFLKTLRINSFIRILKRQFISCRNKSSLDMTPQTNYLHIYKIKNIVIFYQEC